MKDVHFKKVHLSFIYFVLSSTFIRESFTFEGDNTINNSMCQEKVGMKILHICIKALHKGVGVTYHNSMN